MSRNYSLAPRGDGIPTVEEWVRDSFPGWKLVEEVLPAKTQEMENEKRKQFQGFTFQPENETA